MVIPKFRCVGFPEYTYTRTLSTVGDLMGSAEFCFVTIMQRVLGFLRVRCHYILEMGERERGRDREGEGGTEGEGEREKRINS
jgi:hypothetical protein